MYIQAYSLVLMFSLLLISLAMEVKPLYQSVILIITLRIHLLHYVMVQWILLALLALVSCNQNIFYQLRERMSSND